MFLITQLPNFLYVASVKDIIISTGSVKKLINLLRSSDLKIKEGSAVVMCTLSSDGRQCYYFIINSYLIL